MFFMVIVCTEEGSQILTGASSEADVPGTW
jgi:hypothetical protein